MPDFDNMTKDQLKEYAKAHKVHLYSEGILNIRETLKQLYAMNFIEDSENE